MSTRLARAVSAVVLLVLAAIVVTPGLAAPSAQGDWPSTLRVGLIPNQVLTLIPRAVPAVRRLPQRRLGMPVELFVATDYAGVVEAMASDRLDVAYFGGADLRAGRAARRRVPDRHRGRPRDRHDQVLQRDHRAGPILRCRPLPTSRGHRFAFGDIGPPRGRCTRASCWTAPGIGNFTRPADLRVHRRPRRHRARRAERHRRRRRRRAADHEPPIESGQVDGGQHPHRRAGSGRGLPLGRARGARPRAGRPYRERVSSTCRSPSCAPDARRALRARDGAADYDVIRARRAGRPAAVRPVAAPARARSGHRGRQGSQAVPERRGRPARAWTCASSPAS